jgi:hypothetical protein
MKYQITYNGTVSTKGNDMKSFTCNLCAVCLILLVGLLNALPAKQTSSNGHLRGWVTDLYGSPVAEAKIELISDEQFRPYQTRTDSNGNYEFTNLPSGNLTISVNAFGFLQEKRGIYLNKSEKLILDFGLEVGRLTDLPPIEISGRVQQPNKLPLAEATVVVISVFKPQLSLKARTDQTGHYKILVDNPGQYVVVAAKLGLSLEATPITLSSKLPREHRRLDFVLSPFR